MLFLDAPTTSPNVTITFAAISAVISIAAIAFGYFNTMLTLRAKNEEDRRDEIYKILNDLYGPFGQLRRKSSLLYDKFKIGKTPNHKDGHFSTLIYLLENGGPKSLNSNDQAILNEIIDIGNKCETLIYEKAGLTDDERLRVEWFPKVATHYLIIRLAYQGALTGHIDEFKDSTFHVEIDGVVEERIKALQEELQLLNK